MSRSQQPLRLAVARLQGFADGLEDLVRGQHWLPAVGPGTVDVCPLDDDSPCCRPSCQVCGDPRDVEDETPPPLGTARKGGDR